MPLFYFFNPNSVKPTSLNLCSKSFFKITSQDRKKTTEMRETANTKSTTSSTCPRKSRKHRRSNKGRRNIEESTMEIKCHSIVIQLRSQSGQSRLFSALKSTVRSETTSRLSQAVGYFGNVNANLAVIRLF